MPKAPATAKPRKRAAAPAGPDPEIDFGSDEENPALEGTNTYHDELPGDVAGEAADPSTLQALPTLEEGREYINGLWWGKEGSGKTTDVMTAANHGKVLVINAEGGLKKKPLREFGINLDNIVPWPPENRRELISYQGLDTLFWQLKAALDADPDAYFAVVWDSGTEMYKEFVRNEVVKQYRKNQSLPTARRKEHREDEFFTDRSDYGVATDQLRVLLRRFRDLPCHFLVTCLERRDKDEDTGKVVYGPAVGPAFQTDLLGYMDINICTKAGVIQVGDDEDADVIEEFKGLTRPDGRNRSKDRFRSVPRVLSIPTFERVLGYVDDSLNEADDEVQAEYKANRAAHYAWVEGD